MMFLSVFCNIITIQIKYMLFVTFLLSSYKSPTNVGSFSFFKDVNINAVYLSFNDINPLVC